MKRPLIALTCLSALGAVVWISGARQSTDDAADWIPVAPGVYRSPGSPAGYALVDGDEAVLIDAPQSAAGLKKHGVKTIRQVYLTSYHRGICAQLPEFLKGGVKVSAPADAKEWLTPEGVKKYWLESLPLRSSRTAYQVLPTGVEGIDYALKDGQAMDWHVWRIEIVATPGHARAHVALNARRGKDGPRFAFVGGALAAPGKLSTPYTTDWDHWTDAGLTPAAKSLRALADLNPDLLCPAYGPVIKTNAKLALTQTAEAVEEVAFLRSFERFTEKRLGNAPRYKFLAPEQKESNGSKPWSRISEHLWVTGNTFVLTSRDGASLMVDPWDKRSVEQFAKLTKDEKLGPLEVVMFSHAHYDHYDGIYYLPARDSFQVWALDLVALPLGQPYLLRAPFLDARPVRFDKKPKDGDTLAWREYRFKFHHLPGQSEYTMGVETVIDGKKCFLTADNFFHQDMFSGSGGWMGLNRSFPPLYGASAQKVLEAAPDWVLAEHGGPFEFSAEDFRRRVEWAKVSARAADALCLSGNHQHDWNPHSVRVEPIAQKGTPGAMLKWTLVADNVLARKEKVHVRLVGRGVVAEQTWEIEIESGQTQRRDFTARAPANLSPGRHVFIVETNTPADAFLVIDVD